MPARCAKWLRPTPAVHAMSASKPLFAWPGHPTPPRSARRASRHTAPRALATRRPTSRRGAEPGSRACRSVPAPAPAPEPARVPEPAPGPRSDREGRPRPRSAHPRATPRRRANPPPFGASYPSTTRCAFVPEIPNALTAARGGRPPSRGQSVGSDVTRTGSRSQSRCGLGVSKLRCFGIVPWRIERADLDDARNARRRLEMTDVRLHRTHQQRAGGVSSLSVDRGRRLDLDGIAEPRAGSVRFEVVHALRGNPGPGHGLLDHPLLSRPVRYRQTCARAVLVHGRAAHDAPDPVPVRLRVGEPLEDDDSASLGAHVTVRRRIEGPAPPGRGQHPELDHELRDRGGQERVDAAREREIHLASLERRARLVHRGERRRAGEIEGYRRSHEPQREGDPPGRHAPRGPENRDVRSAPGDYLPVLASR